MTLAQGGKVTSGAFPSPSPHSEPGVASQPPGQQQQSRHRERHHEPPHVRAPISQPHSCLHGPTPCELRALAGALKALKRGLGCAGAPPGHSSVTSCVVQLSLSPLCRSCCTGHVQVLSLPVPLHLVTRPRSLPGARKQSPGWCWRDQFCTKRILFKV